MWGEGRAEVRANGDREREEGRMRREAARSPGEGANAVGRGVEGSTLGRWASKFAYGWRRPRDG